MDIIIAENYFTLINMNMLSGLSTEMIGTGVMASTVVTFINYFLSSLEHLIPLELVEWMLGRPLVQGDVMNVEMIVRDCMQIYAAWTKQY